MDIGKRQQHLLKNRLENGENCKKQKSLKRMFLLRVQAMSCYN